MAERKTNEQKLAELEKKMEQLKAQKRRYRQSKARLKGRKERAALFRTAHLLKSI